MIVTEDRGEKQKNKVSPESDTNKTNKDIINDLSENFNNITPEIIKALVKKDIFQMPEIYERTYKAQQERFKDFNKDLLLIQILQAYSYGASERRIKTCLTDGFSDFSFAPNIITIIQANSGGGKDFPQNMLFKHIIKSEEWENKIKEAYNINIEKKITQEATEQNLKGEELQKYFSEQRAKRKMSTTPTRKLERGTFEGLRELAKQLDCAQIGSLFLQSSEYGLYLQSQQGDQKNFFDAIYNGYYGNIGAKTTRGDFAKNNDDTREIENCFINAELHTTDEPFKDKKTMQKFIEATNTGLTRRSFLFKIFIDDFDDESTSEITRKYSHNCEIIKENYKNICANIEPNSYYKITPEVHDIIRLAYQKYLKELRAKFDDTFKEYIKSRLEKAYRIALAFACYNHPKEHLIKPLDYLQAITTIEHIDRSFKQFFNVKKDSYFDKIAGVIMNNLQIGETINKTELYNLCKPIFDNDIRKTREYFNGKSKDRDAIKETFDETIADVNTVLKENNLKFIEAQKVKNEQPYTLTQILKTPDFNINEDF